MTEKTEDSRGSSAEQRRAQVRRCLPKRSIIANILNPATYAGLSINQSGLGYYLI